MHSIVRGGSRTAATSKMEHFVIIVNDWKPLTVITKCFILDVAAVLDPPLTVISIAWSTPFEVFQCPKRKNIRKIWKIEVKRKKKTNKFG